MQRLKTIKNLRVAASIQHDIISHVQNNFDHFNLIIQLIHFKSYLVTFYPMHFN
jgi:hypothetical protein